MDVNQLKQKLASAVNLIKSGLYGEAVQVLRLLAQTYHESIEVWFNLGIALDECKQYEETLKAYDEALAIDTRVPDIWFNKGTVHFKLKEFEKAKECYEKVLELTPEDAEAWNNLGNCHSRLGEGKLAIEAYTRAVALKPDYAEAFYNKANAHFIEGEDERAIAYAELAVELNPELEKLVREWIYVSKDRIAASREHEEYLKRKSTHEKKNELE